MRVCVCIQVCCIFPDDFPDICLWSALWVTLVRLSVRRWATTSLFFSLTLGCYRSKNLTFLQLLDFAGHSSFNFKNIFSCVSSSCCWLLGETVNEYQTRDGSCWQCSICKKNKTEPFVEWFDFLVIVCFFRLSDAFCMCICVQNQHGLPSIQANWHISSHSICMQLH